MKNSVSTIIGVVAAATAGVILGMLIAPKKGDDIRKAIKDSAGDWKKKLGNLLEGGKEELRKSKNSLGHETNSLTNKVKSTTV